MTTARAADTEDETPFLDVTPGSRIMAKLESQISSADPTDVVAVVEYTYAIGDQVVVPAGARVVGKIQQADRNGYIGVKFTEIELLGHPAEKIDAVGKGLDLGPIKGIVTGKNTGKNLFVRSISGIGSVLAEVAGNNSSGAFSEDDLLRERLAENIGTAGDSELMTLNANSRIVVSVPADTKIYVVFNKHEQPQPTLHKVSSTSP
jgi:Bacterial conjugation TrbI-like protein